MTFRVTLIVRTEQGESTIDVSEAIRKLLQREDPPPDLDLRVCFCRVENGVME